jgi:tagatose 6-phosphate kinase
VIVAVALNPALDVTYRMVGPLAFGATNRVASVEQRPGGKALNVARVLGQLGHPARVVAALGGMTGDVVADLAKRLGIDGAWVTVSGETRRTVLAWDEVSGVATSLNEPGAPLSPGEWRSIVATVGELLPADAVVVSGSTAPGIPGNGIAELAALARRSGSPTIFDTSAAALQAAIDARATVVKPNRDELVEILERPIGNSLESVADAATELRAGRDVAVVASDGERGLVAVTAAGRWRAKAPAIARANATGAGDACVAGIAAGLAAGAPWAQRLRLAAALGAAAARQHVAGEVGDYEDVYNATTVEEL